MTAESESRPLPQAPSTLQKWFPIAEWLPKYPWSKFLVPDLIAALSLAALLIPESMGYATVAGVPVHYGLYAAPLALLAYAIFGGSRLLVFATVGSVSALSASLVAALGGGDPQTAITLTIALAWATGLVFLIAGLAKFGWVANFISKAVLKGFIIGMALHIIINQTGKLVGVALEGENSFAKLWSLLEQIPQWELTTAAIGIGALVLILALQKLVPKLPAAIIAVVLSSLVVASLHPDVELVAAIPTGLPSLTFPTGLDPATWGKLLLGGMVMALVAFSEGWGSSQALAQETHDELDPDQEFRAYGIGNIGAGLLGGLAVAGSLSKSEAGLAAGAKSQMSNIILAGIVLLTLAFLAPLFQWLPEAVLGAIVIGAMLEAANPHILIKAWEFNKVDVVLAAITLLAALALDLLPAMLIGIVLSVLYMVYRVSFPGQAELGRDPRTGEYRVLAWTYHGRHAEADTDAQRVPGVIICRSAAPLIFSNAEAFKQAARHLLIQAAERNEMPHHLVIDFELIAYLDLTGAAALRDTAAYARRYEVDVLLARVHGTARRLLEKTGLQDILGPDHLFPSVHDAVEAATADKQPVQAGENPQ